MNKNPPKIPIMALLRLTLVGTTIKIFLSIFTFLIYKGCINGLKFRIKFFYYNLISLQILVIL